MCVTIGSSDISRGLCDFRKCEFHMLIIVVIGDEPCLVGCEVTGNCHRGYRVDFRYRTGDYLPDHAGGRTVCQLSWSVAALFGSTAVAVAVSSNT